MFVSINIYFRPYEFLAIYQRFTFKILCRYPDSVYNRTAS